MEKLFFKSLKIRRAPGFPDGLLADGSDSLSEGINIITGPNSSGKTTTANLINDILWQNRSKGTSADGELVYKDQQWTFQKDSDYLRFYKNGEIAATQWGADKLTQQNYNLSLHNLINESDADLARIIERESVGGYDTEAAAADLSYSRSVRNTRSTEFIDFQSKRKIVLELLQKQSKVKNDEAKLKSLLQREASARKAAGLERFYSLVIKYLTAKQNCDKAESRLAVYPKSISGVTGDEPETLTRLIKRLSEESNAIREARDSVLESRKRISQLALKEEIESHKIIDIEQRIKEISAIKHEVATLESEIASNNAKSYELLQGLGVKNPEEWSGIAIDNLSKIDAFFRKSFDLYSEKRAIEVEINFLSDSTEEDVDVAAIEKRIENLKDWVNHFKRKNRWFYRYLKIIAVFFAAVTTALFLLFSALYALSFLTASAVISIWLKRKKQRNNLSLMNLQSSYLSVQPASVPEWKLESVLYSIKELEEELLASKILNRENYIKRDRLRNLRVLLEKIEPSLKETEEIRLEIEMSIGSLDINIDNHFTLSSLYWFLKNLDEWKKVQLSLVAARARLNLLKNNLSGQLELCNLFFRQFLGEEAGDLISAEALYRRLKDENSKLKEALNVIENNERLHESAQQRMISATSEMDEMFERLSVSDRDAGAVNKLVEMLPSYREDAERYRDAVVSLNLIKAELMSDSLFSDNESVIETIPIERAVGLKADYEKEAKETEEISTQIAEIKHSVSSLMEGNELEEAINAEKQSLEKLNNLFQLNIQSSTGAIVVSHIKKVCESEYQPQVLQRADQIFSSITANRYHLRVSGTNQPQFTALDNVTQKVLSLDEISTGTRVQLLLSVRVAFAESLEDDVRLPILADELLANSDDTRANAIIDALLGIAKEGRQIFYFTAQPDEVVKWTKYIEDYKKINYRVIYLDISEKYDLFTSMTGELPLSYLTDNTLIVSECKRKGVRLWGQLHTFLERGGRIESLSTHEFNMMKNKTALLEEYRRLYTRGRPSRVTMDVIVDSGIISDTFIEPVSEQLKRANYDPSLFLSFLEEIPRFRKATAEQIREHLYAHNFLNDEIPLKDEDLDKELINISRRVGVEESEAKKFINSIPAGYSRIQKVE